MQITKSDCNDYCLLGCYIYSLVDEYKIHMAARGRLVTEVAGSCVISAHIVLD